ncbi:MAG TPA: electron transport complex subunit G [Ruminococcus sp.]|nr:electron transport complex subunit G [Ruminococcus sp.]
MKSFTPPLVLSVVCIAVSGLLAFANQLTAPRIAKAQEEKLSKSLVEVFGEADYKTLDKSFENVNQVITDENNRAVFDITVDGYSKDGIEALIGIDSEGKVCGIGIVSLKETTGIGTRIQVNDYIEKFIGLDNDDFPDDTIISGATYSSKGMRNAVSIAVSTYSQNKEVIFSE